MNKRLLLGLATAALAGCNFNLKEAAKTVAFDASPRNLPLWILYRKINSTNHTYVCTPPEVAEAAAMTALEKIGATYRYTTRVGRSCTIYSYINGGEAVIIDVDPKCSGTQARINVCIGRYGDRARQAIFFSHINLPPNIFAPLEIKVDVVNELPSTAGELPPERDEKSIALDAAASPDETIARDDEKIEDKFDAESEEIDDEDLEEEAANQEDTP